MSQAERIRSLDGLRAVAISTTIIAHATGQLAYPVLAGFHVPNPGYALGAMSVRLFFIISGFLITGQLVQERSAHGTVNVGKFYVRRVLRLVPAYVIFVAVVAILASRGEIAVGSRDLIAAATFTMDYRARPAWEVLHLWSLSVEWQFYLLWPLVIALLRPRWARALSIAAIVLPAIIRVVEGAVFPEWRHTLIGHSFETSADALALGCALALFRDHLHSSAVYRRLISSWAIPALLIAVGVLLLAPSRFSLEVLVGIPLTNLGMTVGLDRAVLHHDGVIGRALNSGALIWLGAISYSLYLWQQLFLGPAAHGWSLLPLAGAVMCATLSYYVVERPMNRLRPHARSADRGVRGVTALHP